MYKYFSYMYICMPCVCLVSEVRKWEWDHLQLELWMIVSYHVGDRNQTQAFARTKNALQH